METVQGAGSRFQPRQTEGLLRWVSCSTRRGTAWSSRHRPRSTSRRSKTRSSIDCSSQINSIEIAHYPDRPETWRLTHRVGAALVMYKGAQYGELLDTAAIIQERKLEFEIAVMMRDLGWAVGGDPSGPSPGAYAIIEAIRTALTGYRIPGCRKMYPVREKFVKRDKQGGVWTYASTFRTQHRRSRSLAAGGVPALHQGHRAGRRRTNLHHARRGGLHIQFEPAGSASAGQRVCRQHHAARRRGADPGYGLLGRSRRTE